MSSCTVRLLASSLGAWVTCGSCDWCPRSLHNEGKLAPTGIREGVQCSLM